MVINDRDAVLTTGAAARCLGVSRQHVVDLCNEGVLAHVFVGAHRRVRQRDVEEVAAGASRMTRDQVRSLQLSFAVAGKLAIDPGPGLARARRNLASMRSSASGVGARQWLDEWDRILDGPLIGVLRALTSDSPMSRELRQNSPFAGVLSEAERAAVLAHFTASQRASG